MRGWSRRRPLRALAGRGRERSDVAARDAGAPAARPQPACTSGHSMSTAPTNEPGTASAVLDMNIIRNLRELGGDDDPGLLPELIAIFLRDAPQRLGDISAGLRGGDLDRLERAAHT